jgi:hypothetical protein
LPEIGWRTLWAFNAILPIAYAALCFLRFGLGEQGPLGTSPLSDIEALFQRAHRFIWHWLSDFTLSLMSRLPGSCRSSLSHNCICLSLPRACSRRLLSRRMSSAIIMAGVLLRAGVPIWANVAMSFTVYGIVSLVIFASGVGGGRDCNDGSNHARYRRSVTRLDLRRGAALRAQSATGFLAASRRHGHS